jgi:fumarate hydratase class II
MNARDEPGPLWGAQTTLALQHFAIGDERMPLELVHALALIKGAAAQVNARLGRLDDDLAQAIDDAAQAVLSGRHDPQFPLSPWQSGSGTQTHMNVNEVLAALGSAALPAGRSLHPNDHVNRGQSSNDTVPSAIHIALHRLARERLLPALERLVETLQAQAQRHAGVVKLGRTHLQDAVPMTAGQEFGAWAGQVLAARRAIDATLAALLELPLGGTAVGTGLNTHPEFAVEVCRELARRSGVAFVPAPDRFAAIAGAEAVTAFHGALKVLATALMKLANDVRLLASGPHAGLGELVLPANEPGSSIMPGKVNPTQCESLLMVCCQVIADDVAVTLAAAGGQLQLNTCRPLLAVNALRSVRLLADGIASFEHHALQGLELGEERIAAAVRASLMSATALAPHIGYDRAARIVANAQQRGVPLREAALGAGVAAADFDRWTDPRQMLGPA